MKKENKTRSESKAGLGLRVGPGGRHAMGRPVEKAKDFKGTVKRLLRYLKPQKYKLIGVVILAILSTAFNIISPKIMGLATNEVWDGIRSTSSFIDFAYIKRIVISLIVLYIFSAFFYFAMGFIMSGVSQTTVYNMRNDINHKLGRLPLSTIVTMQIVKRSQKLFKERQKSLGELNGHVEEMYTGHRVVKAFGYEKKSIAKFNDINEKLFEAGWKAESISGIVMPLLMFINNLGYVLICVVGGIFVARGTLAIGFIQAFIQYSKKFTQPIVQTANIANIIQSTVASAERVFELLDEEEEVSDELATGNIDKSQGKVKFKDVRFGYKPDVPVIKNLNIEVKSGQTIAIVGPTGAGKTTLVNLLMRFYEIDLGSITIDGIDITQMKRENLRSIFGMVLQDTWLFNGTIRENIAYGKKGATEEEILKAAKAAHVDHFIRTLPDGYDTILDEEASNISQGQKQLLTIARALLANPSILILDEATSSVDTRTESYIQNAMTKLMEGRTNFVIAHRLSTIKDADLILVMNHGDIVEQGTHHQLLEKEGFYADLYNSQFAFGEINQAV